MKIHLKIADSIGFIIFMIINFLFSAKYFIRYTEKGFYLSVLYMIILFMVYYFFKTKQKKFLSSAALYWGLLIIYIILISVIFTQLKVGELNVDRWSVIANFWDKAFRLEYPYSTQSNMGNYPGPFPVYFLLTLPFYFIHEIGYLSLLGLAGLVWLLRKDLQAQDSLSILVLSILSVALFWEMITRSTVFVNSVLFIFYFRWLVALDLKSIRNVVLTAIAGGAILSTRSIFAFPFIFYIGYLLKTKSINLQKMIIWISIAFIIFCFTFLPFIVLSYKEFLMVNPFKVQSENILPFGYVPVLLCLSFIFGFLCKNDKDIFIWIGILLFIIFIIYAARLCVINGLMYAYEHSIIDISYALFSLPFILYSFFPGREKKHTLSGQ